MSTQEQEALAAHVRNFLIGHAPLVDEHVQFFETGIHYTSNFLPWHRAHVRELEYYIQEQLGMEPEELYLLPKWAPRTLTVTNWPIPPSFQETYVSGIEGVPGGATSPILNANPVISDFPPHCDITDHGQFSNYLETQYHDIGHGSIGGIMAEFNSPAVLVFWPWHAQVDNLWYDWEAANCEEGYTKSPYWFNLDIFEDDVWEGEHFVKGEVVVRSGVTLTIAPGAVIHFRDSDYESYATRIVVEPGGTLLVNGGKLTGIDRFGSIGDGGGGVEYHTGWKGIVVQGTGVKGGNHGRVVLHGDAVIEYAKTGILSENGGQVVAVGANFKNCRKGVEIRDYPYNDGLFMLDVCTFSNDEPLRDVTWISAPIGGQVKTINFNHRVTESTEYHVYLDNVNRVQVIGCTFSNEFKDYNPPYRATGIYAAGNATFDCTGGSFTGLAGGIIGNHCGPNSPAIRGVTFDDNQSSVHLSACTASLIADNNFSLGTNQKNKGIEIWNSSWLGINNNIFDGAGSDPVNGQRAIIVENSQQGPSQNIPNSIRSNTFTGSPIQMQFQGANQKVQFTCNSFNAFQRAVAVSSGVIPDQGNCILGMPAGNIWDNFGCSGNESQLYRMDVAGGFNYAAHSDRLPTCTSIGIDPQNCGFSNADRPICGVEQGCNPACDETAINNLEQQKQAVLIDNNLTESEKNSQVVILNFQQELIAQTGLASALNSDSSLNAGIAYLELLKEEFAFNVYQRIFIYLSSGDSLSAKYIIDELSSGNDKTLWQLYYNLHNEHRNYSQMTTSEKEIMETIAQGGDWPAAQAQAILTGIKGAVINISPEPLGEVFLERPNKDFYYQKFYEHKQLVCWPNPSNNEIKIRYQLPVDCIRGRLVLTDLYGQVIQTEVLSATSNSSEISLGTLQLSSGVYIVCLVSDGYPIDYVKVSFVK